MWHVLCLEVVSTVRGMWPPVTELLAKEKITKKKYSNSQMPHLITVASQ